jgi:U3 small nucleolar ribonucleoprotein protein LCP5
LDTSAGISLLTIKQHLLISYLRSLSLLCANKALGHSIETVNPRKSLVFSDTNRPLRSIDSHSLVDSLIENRIVLEKVRALEARMRYQIEKIVKFASEDDSTPTHVENGTSFYLLFPAFLQILTIYISLI